MNIINYYGKKMIDFNAIFKLSYGLYIVCSGDKNKGNGYIANAAFQVTAEPPQFAVCCNKDNYSVDFIKDSKAFSLSILEQDASSDIIGKFGYKSGREADKLSGCNIRYGETGVPIVIDDSVAFMECKLVQTFDVGTHYIFIGEIVAAELLDDVKVPITYAHYRNVRKGFAPKNAPTYIDKSKLNEASEVKKEVTETKPIETEEISAEELYKCGVCGYVYDSAQGDTANGIASGTHFDDLPDDWTCPICGMGKEEFSLV